MKNSTFTFLLLFMAHFLWAQSDVGTRITLNMNEIQEVIKEVPSVSAINATNKFMVITLPLPDGRDIDFVVKHAPLVKEDSPLYKTSAGQIYSLYGVDEAGYNGSMILYKDGIHATLNTPNGLLFISKTNEEFVHDYVYFKDTDGFPHNPNDAVYPDALPTDNGIAPHRHSINEEDHTHNMPEMRNSLANNNFFSVGGNNTRPSLDLFIMSETNFVNKFANQAAAEARIIEIVNGVKVILEQDINLTINYLGTYFKPGAEGAATGNAVNLYNSLSDGDVPTGTKAGVDLAHLLVGLNGNSIFGHGAGTIGAACVGNLPFQGFLGLKAGGYSAYSVPTDASFIPLVAHEIGHQLGGSHTWTGSAGNCSSQQYGSLSGVEPGSGSTMSSYSGICGSDNVPGTSSSTYNHTEAIREMSTLVTTYKTKSIIDIIQSTPPTLNGIPDFPDTYIGFSSDAPQCITTVAHPNNIPQANSNPNNLSNLNIPARTPFEVTGSATDGDGDNLTYQWDQMDFALGQQSIDGYATRQDGPLFRSFAPTSSPTRIFPQLSDILAGTQTKGEILPQTDRQIRLACTVRDGKGGVGIDAVIFNVVDSGTGFGITNVNTATAGSVALTWEVANTATSPISCNNIDILLSTDGGNTFSTTLATNTANDGSETVTIPEGVNTTQGRIKIKCSTSVFFNINNANITVNGVAAGNPGYGEDGCGGATSFMVMDADVPGTNGIFQTNAAIETSGTVNVESSDGAVEFKSGTSITLNTGFHAQAGSTFFATIATCSALQDEDPMVYRLRSATPTVQELDLTITPNPSREFANLTFSLVKPSQVNLTIYDMSGRAVESMLQGQVMNAGSHQIQYTPQSIEGGVYYVVLQADNEVVTKKMILVR